MSYIQKGERQAKMFKEHCPVTLHLLEQSVGRDNLMTGTPFSYTFFSTMSPGTWITPHYGACNIKLRCHFPLFVPPQGQTYLRVGEDETEWQAGKMLIFDDTYEHEAANKSKEEERVVLIVDIWHPDLSAEEKIAIQNMFGVVKEMIEKRK